MITLTNPVLIESQLGGTATVAYNKCRIVQITADPVTQTITGQVQLLSTSNASAPVISGTLSITTTGTPTALLQISSLGITWSFGETAAASTIQGWITTLQNSLEQGVISQGGVAGIQSTGV